MNPNIYISEIEKYMEKAKTVLKSNNTDPSAQKVMFYGECAIRSAKRKLKPEMSNYRSLVIGFSS